MFDMRFRQCLSNGFLAMQIMPRQARDARLHNRSSRKKLAPRGPAYFHKLDPGLDVGYRRLRGRPGAWVVRLYEGDGTYRHETFATADDWSPANGVDVLDWRQAQETARRRRDERVRVAAGKGSAITVGDAIARYLQSLAARGKNTTDTRVRAEVSICRCRPCPGCRSHHRPVAQVAARPRAAAETAAHRQGPAQRFHRDSSDPEAIRRRRATANRYVAILRSALTVAFRDGLVASDQAWRRVKLFENVTAAASATSRSRRRRG